MQALLIKLKFCDKLSMSSVILDPDFSWNGHITTVARAAACKPGFLFRTLFHTHSASYSNQDSNSLLSRILLLLLLLLFFFFYEIECKKGRTRMMQPLCISKDPCITEEKGKLIKWEGGGVDMICICGEEPPKAFPCYLGCNSEESYQTNTRSSDTLDFLAIVELSQTFSFFIDTTMSFVLTISLLKIQLREIHGFQRPRLN